MLKPSLRAAARPSLASLPSSAIGTVGMVVDELLHHGAAVVGGVILDDDQLEVDALAGGDAGQASR